MEEQWHVTLATDGRRTLFPTQDALRRAVRTLARVAGDSTLLFCIVDDHLHDVLGCDRQRAGRLAQALQLALGPLASVPLDGEARIRPVEDRDHLETLVKYVIRQPVHHGLPVHPAMWEGSCFPDMIGGRVVGSLGQKLAPLLPRLRLWQVMEYAGLPARPVVPADDARLRRAGARGIVAAAAAAAALAISDSSGKSDAARAVRSVVAANAHRLGMPTRETAEALGVSMRAVERWAQMAPAPKLDLAVRVRVALEDIVADAAAKAVLERKAGGPAMG